MNKIYVFINSKWASGDVVPIALAEDGHCLGSHFCSHEGFVKHDMGFTSDWKHESYNKHYPDGWELEWIDDPKKHEGVQKALELNREIGKKAEEAEAVEVD